MMLPFIKKANNEQNDEVSDTTKAEMKMIAD